MVDGPVRSLVLSGGGARGAYEVGVLKYIFTELPQKLLEKGRIQILSGTSVGAINACFLAANAHEPQSNIEKLANLWRGLRLDQFLRINGRDMVRLPLELRSFFQQTEHQRGFLINTEALQRLVTQEVDWPRIRHNLERGVISSLTVSATHISSGKTMVFIDRADGGVPPWTRDQRRVARAARIGPAHAIASAAIPVLFPAVAIDGAYYCDGGLRQNTPLSPALRLGADRVLVIAVGHGRGGGPIPQQEEKEVYPGPSVLLGKVFNALLLDHLDYDLAQLRGFNRLLDDGKLAFGDSFLTELSKTTERIRGAGYRNVASLVVRPSRDLGEMAADFMAAGNVHLEGVGGWMLRRLAVHSAAKNSDLLSYLLFDGTLAEALIALGMHDADAARTELINFFQD